MVYGRVGCRVRVEWLHNHLTEQDTSKKTVLQRRPSDVNISVLPSKTQSTAVARVPPSMTAAISRKLDSITRISPSPFAARPTLDIRPGASFGSGLNDPQVKTVRPGSILQQRQVDLSSIRRAGQQVAVQSTLPQVLFKKATSKDGGEKIQRGREGFRVLNPPSTTQLRYGVEQEVKRVLPRRDAVTQVSGDLGYTATRISDTLVWPKGQNTQSWERKYLRPKDAEVNWKARLRARLGNPSEKLKHSSGKRSINPGTTTQVGVVKGKSESGILRSRRKR